MTKLFEQNNCLLGECMKPFVYGMTFSLALALAGCGSDESEAVAVTTSTDSCHLDFINGSQERLVQVAPGRMDIRGWAFDKSTMTTPANIEVVFKDTQGNAFNFAGGKRGERLDVAKAYSRESIKNAGFLLYADASALPQGVYSIMVKMSEGKRTVQCTIKKNVKFI
jgi:hypothetical protein